MDSLRWLMLWLTMLSMTTLTTVVLRQPMIQKRHTSMLFTRLTNNLFQLITLLRTQRATLWVAISYSSLRTLATSLVRQMKASVMPMSWRWLAMRWSKLVMQLRFWIQRLMRLQIRWIRRNYSQLWQQRRWFTIKWMHQWRTSQLFQLIRQLMDLLVKITNLTLFLRFRVTRFWWRVMMVRWMIRVTMMLLRTAFQERLTLLILLRMPLLITQLRTSHLAKTLSCTTMWLSQQVCPYLIMSSCLVIQHRQLQQIRRTVCHQSQHLDM